MITSRRRVVVLPRLVVDRNSHFWAVPVVQAVSTSVSLIAPVVLWVRDIRVVVKAIEVLRAFTRSPRLSECSFLSLSCIGLADDANRKRSHYHGGKKYTTKHRVLRKWSVITENVSPTDLFGSTRLGRFIVNETTAIYRMFSIIV